MNLRELAAHRWSREWVSCARKVLIYTKYEAWVAETKMALKHPRYVFKHYQCPYCGGYHVGRVSSRSQIKMMEAKRKLMNNSLRMMQPYWVFMWGEK